MSYSVRGRRLTRGESKNYQRFISKMLLGVLVFHRKTYGEPIDRLQEDL